MNNHEKYSPSMMVSSTAVQPNHSEHIVLSGHKWEMINCTDFALCLREDEYMRVPYRVDVLPLSSSRTQQLPSPIRWLV